MYTSLLYGKNKNWYKESSDSLYLNIEQAELIFLEKNFQLIAQKYNISFAEAAVEQARLWNNPSFFGEITLYNPNDHRLFDFTDKNGQVELHLDQIIRLAGKRTKLVKMQETNKSIAFHTFQDVLRSLKLQLYQDFYTIYFDLRKLNLLTLEETQLEQLLKASEIRLKDGDIAGYDILRINYELQDIRIHKGDIIKDINDNESDLRIMLRLTSNHFVVPVKKENSQSPIKYELPVLEDSALSRRPDLKVAKDELSFSEINYLYQKANAIPDLAIGSTYDRFGNAFQNYIGVNAAIDLPLFNRNQGNIKLSQLKKELTAKAIDHAILQLKEEVNNANIRFQTVNEIYMKIDSNYKINLDQILPKAIQLYESKTIGILDFMDKIRTYENGKMDLYEVEYNLTISQIQINYVTNSIFY
ncbi:TolC family protein [Sporocytophaga sp.]|uniref:TolC family protein n=1 Tax=Sporocytophaga sp. TaxID=2231183 RepID=UPI0025FA24D3|nr:TolC family protein [Sporocytophaga sp.]